MARDRTAGPDDVDLDPPEGPDDEATHIRCRLGDVLAARDMTLTELSARTGITVVNLSVLKNNRARAVRFSTLARICAVLDVTPGELLEHAPPDDGAGA